MQVPHVKEVDERCQTKAANDAALESELSDATFTSG